MADEPNPKPDEPAPVIAATSWEPPGFRRVATRAPLRPGARAQRPRRSNYFAKVRLR